MKRNNIFMWAYIVAIILCVFRRVKQDYTTWNPIVVAVTVSSIIFAIEDLAKSIYQTLDDNVQYLESYIDEIKTNLAEEGDILSRIAQKLVQSSTSEERRKQIESTEETLSQVIQLTHKSIQKYEKSKTIYKTLTDIFRQNIDRLTFLGFLSIFFILFFSDKVQISVANQELLTVVAFAIILITQQINQLTSDNIKRHIGELEELRNKNKESIEEAIELERAVNKFVNRQEIIDVEAIANAH